MFYYLIEHAALSKLNAIVEIPNDVNQIPITGNNANAKCNERELLNDEYVAVGKTSVFTYEYLVYLAQNHTCNFHCMWLF